MANEENINIVMYFVPLYYLYYSSRPRTRPKVRRSSSTSSNSLCCNNNSNSNSSNKSASGEA